MLPCSRMGRRVNPARAAPGRWTVRVPDGRCGAVIYRGIDWLLGWLVLSDVLIYVLHRPVQATLPWGIAALAGWVIALMLRPKVESSGRWDFREFGPGPWNTKN